MPAIFVCGVPGSGKTTIGRELGKRLGCRSFDVDEDVGTPLFPPLEAGNTIVAFNNFRNGKVHEALFAIADAWVTKGETIVVMVPMIREVRQPFLEAFCKDHPDTKIFLCMMEDREEAIRRMQARGGHRGGVDTIEEWENVRASAVPIPLPHVKISTAPPKTVEQCVEEALASIGAT